MADIFQTAFCNALSEKVCIFQIQIQIQIQILKKCIGHK